MPTRHPQRFHCTLLNPRVATVLSCRWGFSVVCGNQEEGSIQRLVEGKKAQIFPAKYFDDLAIRLEDELARARSDGESIFGSKDFDGMLRAREAFSLIQGQALPQHLLKRISTRRLSGLAAAPAAATASEESATVEHKAPTETASGMVDVRVEYT